MLKLRMFLKNILNSVKMQLFLNKFPINMSTDLKANKLALRIIHSNVLFWGY